MGYTTGISWCDHTFNPAIGCTKVSSGCKHCYAEIWDNRGMLPGHVSHWGPGAPRRITSKSNWNKVLKWNKEAVEAGIRKKVFCASLSDVFDDEFPREAQIRLWDLIEECEGLDWLLLTKRPHNIEASVPISWIDKPLKHVWYGTTVEEDKVEYRIEQLASVPASKRFLSCEPLLGPVFRSGTSLAGIHWVIFGGESDIGMGEVARPMDVEWVKDGIAECNKRKIPVFVKQMGSVWKRKWSSASKKGEIVSEWLPEIQLQQFPE